jgi:hypothetical protein
MADDDRAVDVTAAQVPQQALVVTLGGLDQQHQLR